MSVNIKYKGNTISLINTTATKTLKTSGKYCEDNIVVENTRDIGTYQTKTVSPTTASQIVTPDTGYDALSQVNVEAVTSSIDNNIQAGNIKKNVSILGVTGTFEGGITPTGTINITENGTYDVTNYANANVNVSGSDIPASESGYTEFDIFVSKITGLTIPCNMVGEKDWGDGTVDSLTEHTYTDYGYYTIICKGTMLPAGSSSIGGTFGSTSSNNNAFICLALRVGNNVTAVNQYSLFHCKSLEYVHIPNGVSNIATTAFRNCYSLTRVRMPSGVSSILGNAFYTCYALREINLEYITDIASGGFQNCYSLEKVKFGVSIESIGASSFSNNYSLIEIDFTDCTSIPSLANISAFTACNGALRIIVPDALYDSWIVATNWSTYADYIYKASEVA